MKDWTEMEIGPKNMPELNRRGLNARAPMEENGGEDTEKRERRRQRKEVLRGEVAVRKKK